MEDVIKLPKLHWKNYIHDKVKEAALIHLIEENKSKNLNKTYKV